MNKVGSLTIKELNKRKYAKAPTWEQIDSFIKEMGMNVSHFERFYGIRRNHLHSVKAGSEKYLCTQYWHIFYERIKPAYGEGFVNDYTHRIVKGQPRLRKKFSRNRKPNKVKEELLKSDKHSRLDKLL